MTKTTQRFRVIKTDKEINECSEMKFRCDLEERLFWFDQEFVMLMDEWEEAESISHELALYCLKNCIPLPDLNRYGILSPWVDAPDTSPSTKELINLCEIAESACNYLKRWISDMNGYIERLNERIDK